MKFFIQMAEAMALLVPDFLILGLVTAAFFNFYWIAKACPLTDTAEVDSDFVITLMLAYLVTITVNIVSRLLTPAHPGITAPRRSKSQSALKACELPPRQSRAQCAEQDGTFITP